MPHKPLLGGHGPTSIKPFGISLFAGPAMVLPRVVAGTPPRIYRGCALSLSSSCSSYVAVWWHGTEALLLQRQGLAFA